MAVAAAELPELAAGAADRPALAARARTALARTAFLHLGAAAAYLFLGLPIVGALFLTGSFGADDARLVYLVLAGYALGLPAATASRLLQNVFYALGAAAQPARVAVQRVALAVALGVPAMLVLDRLPLAAVWQGAQAPLSLGPLGLALGASAAAWSELGLLRRRLRRELPELHAPWAQAGRALLAALGAAAASGLLWLALPPLHPFWQAAVLLPCFAAVYLLGARAAGVGEAERWLRRLRRSASPR
jgi:putative peptidoglycan lipid II flippase